MPNGKPKSAGGRLAKKKAPQQVAVAWRNPFNQTELMTELFTIDALAKHVDGRTVCRVVAKAQGVESSALNIYFCQGQEALNPKMATKLDIANCGEGTNGEVWVNVDVFAKEAAQKEDKKKKKKKKGKH